MILGHVKCGQGQKALELFQQMQHEGVRSDSVTFVGLLNACASLVGLEEARCAHEQIIQMDGIQMFVWAVAWWTCMQNVGAWRMLGECSTRCHLEM
jgi:pentatricopeptide repeat protein